MKKVIKSTNQIIILFLWVDSDGPPYISNIPCLCSASNLETNFLSSSWAFISSTASFRVTFVPCLVTIFHGVTTYLSLVTISSFPSETL